MKRFIILINLILSIGIQCRSQDSLFVLHPLVGDVIDRNEKIDYLLFPEINDSLFSYCQIKQVEERFFVISHLVSDSVITIQLNISEINQYNKNIDKLHEYYSSQPDEDTLINLKALILKEGNSFQIIDITIDSDKLSNETRAEDRLRDDADRLRLQKQGSDAGGIYIDFDYIKKKKKK
jgi:hypothetical protein